ncbi:MAG: ribokinase [Spirochaetales bacterium]|jgi:ribokinase|nr:ribokinase [Spirochaetales bacterium]
MKNQPVILVVGSINMDLVLRADRIPAPGESYFGEEYRYIPGGKGANQAAAASKLGADVTFAGRVGNDDHGRLVKENLENQGISTHMIVSDPDSPTGLAVIILEPNGQNRIMVYAGANMRIDPSDLEPVFEHTYDAVMMNFEVPDIILTEVCRQAHKRDIPIIVDAGPARAVDLKTLGTLEILSPNETESEALTGIPCDTDANIKAAALALKNASDARHIVTKLGKRGALCLTNDEFTHFETYEVEVVDTTAAGDAFTAGMSLRYLETGDIKQAIRFGNAAGSLAVTKLGAQPSLPNRIDTDNFLAHQSDAI